MRFKVSDYERWRVLFDESRPEREAAGLREREVLRCLRQPNEVVLLMGFNDIDKAEAFVDTARRQGEWVREGLVERPDICYLA